MAPKHLREMESTLTRVTILPDEGTSAGFAYRVDYRPAFALGTIRFEPNRAVSAQAGAMVSMSGDMELTSRMEGGIVGALKRTVGGRSAFVSTFTAGPQGGELTLAPSTPGDIVPIRVENGECHVAAAAYLASDPGLEIDTDWAGARGFFASDRLFLLRVSGTGTLFTSAFGALHTKTLEPGERYSIDSGHVITWDSAMDYRVHKAANNLFRSFASGEGFIVEFTGPGTILMQTRNLEAFAHILALVSGMDEDRGLSMSR